MHSGGLDLLSRPSGTPTDTKKYTRIQSIWYCGIKHIVSSVFLLIISDMPGTMLVRELHFLLLPTSAISLISIQIKSESTKEYAPSRECQKTIQDPHYPPPTPGGSRKNSFDIYPGIRVWYQLTNCQIQMNVVHCPIRHAHRSLSVRVRAPMVYFEVRC